jgi:hypothetical protein
VLCPGHRDHLDGDGRVAEHHVAGVGPEPSRTVTASAKRQGNRFPAAYATRRGGVPHVRRKLPGRGGPV